MGETQGGRFLNKGNPALAENYRRSSWLESARELFAAILAARLSEALGGAIRDTQYGLRQGRSTTDAIFAVRRALELTEERKRGTLRAVFVDWSKAVDRLKPGVVTSALWRFGAPQEHRGLVE
eukprot:3518637-Alexandrium_andersonii.AAC.1